MFCVENLSCDFLRSYVKRKMNLHVWCMNDNDLRDMQCVCACHPENHFLLKSPICASQNPFSKAVSLARPGERPTLSSHSSAIMINKFGLNGIKLEHIKLLNLHE